MCVCVCVNEYICMDILMTEFICMQCWCDVVWKTHNY